MRSSFRKGAPVILEGLDLDNQADKPTLITRFTKHSKEWSDAKYFNVRTGKSYRITTGESKSKNVIRVRSYRQVLDDYVNNAESKFNGPDGKQCMFNTRGILQRTDVIADQHNYCGKETNRKFEAGPLDHETDFKCKIYASGRVAADAKMLRQLSHYSERELSESTKVNRKPIRTLRRGGKVTRRIFNKIVQFLKEQELRKEPHGCGLTRPLTLHRAPNLY